MKNNQKLCVAGISIVTGDFHNTDEFVNAVYNGKQVYKNFPQDRISDSFHSLLNEYHIKPDVLPKGAYIYDYDFCEIKSNLNKIENQTTFQQKLLINVLYNAIVDADLAKGSRTALITSLGYEFSDSQLIEYLSHSIKDGDSVIIPEKNSNTSLLAKDIAERIKNLWEFSGPVQSCCGKENTFFEALRSAETLLTEGDIEAVVIGISDLSSCVESLISFLRDAQIPKVFSLSFNTDTLGIIPGDGAGAVVIMMEDLALERDKTIYSVIETIGDHINNTGIKSFENALIQACENAYGTSMIETNDIEYIELNASGIKLQDEEEVKALKTVFRTGQGICDCAIGSIKANIGYTSRASGLIGFIKTVLCLYHRFLPSVPNWSRSKYDDLNRDTPFFIPDHSQTWFKDSSFKKRIAAINGIDKDNHCFHLVLSEYPGLKRNHLPLLRNYDCLFIPVIGRTENELTEKLGKLREINITENNPFLIMERSLNEFTETKNFPYRLILIAKNRVLLLKEIDYFLENIHTAFQTQNNLKTPSGSYFTPIPLGKETKIAFVYPGIGSAYLDIGRDLLYYFPQVYDSLCSRFRNFSKNLCEKTIYPRSLNKLTSTEKHEAEKKLYQNGNIMPSLGMSFSVIYTEILKKIFNIKSDLVFGYSLGESSMLFSMEVWKNADYMEKFIENSDLFTKDLHGEMAAATEEAFFHEKENTLENEWCTLIVKTDVKKLKLALKNKKHVFLTYINTDDEAIISGLYSQCRDVIKDLKVPLISLPYNAIFHCPIVKKRKQELVKLFSTPVEKICGVPLFFSSVYKMIEPQKEVIAENLANTLCQCVDFPRLVNKVYENDIRIFIEVGARNNCSNWIDKILKDRPHLSIPVNIKGENNIITILKLLSILISHGFDIDLTNLYCLKNNILKNDFKIQKEDPYLKSKNIRKILWHMSDMINFSVGKISHVFGEGYQMIDSFSNRLRLPSLPYLWIGRVTEFHAKKGEYNACSVQTEYDIPDDSYFSVDHQLILGVLLEGIQGLVLLPSYIGADLKNNGNNIYRMIHTKIMFLDNLPKTGDTLQYNLRIRYFFFIKNEIFFVFEGECINKSVHQKSNIIFKIMDGYAGILIKQEPDNKKTIKAPFEYDKIQPGQAADDLNRNQILVKKQFSSEEIKSLMNGIISKCFGTEYDHGPLKPALLFPPEYVMMFDKIIFLDSKNASELKEEIIAEKALKVSDWYFNCNVKGDFHLPFSLLIEGSYQILQFYFLYLGLQYKTQYSRFQPLKQNTIETTYRESIKPVNGLFIYHLRITEVGNNENPYIKADADIIFKNQIVYQIKNIGIALYKEKGLEQGENHRESVNSPYVLTRTQIEGLGEGMPVENINEIYKVYQNRRMPRGPRGDLLAVHRAKNFQGMRFNFSNMSSIECEYDVPKRPWYMIQNSIQKLPYCMIMEIALQPAACHLLYQGTILLNPDKEYRFRNLDGWGILIQDINPEGKTIFSHMELLSTSILTEVILQNFKFKIYCEDNLFYQGETVFGFFDDNAMSKQVGLDQGIPVPFWYMENLQDQNTFIEIDLNSAVNKTKFYEIKKERPHFYLAGSQLNFLDKVIVSEKSGRYHSGYLYGFKNVSSSEWYFKHHFYHDPVMPGSLGVQTMVQALQIYALQFNLGKFFLSPCFKQILNHKITWKYRGQIVPDDRNLHIEVHIKQIAYEHSRILIVGDGYLWKDKIRIYEVKDIGISIEECT